MITENVPSPVVEVVDWTSLGAIVAAIATWIPQISGLLGAVWLAIRIWETDTVKGWTGRKEK